MRNIVFICWLWQQKEAKGKEIMVTIHRLALDEVNEQREKGYTVGMADTPDDVQKNCPKHVEFCSKNKFEKLVHIIDFITRNVTEFSNTVGVQFGIQVYG
jgi:hypothetical protein